MNDTPEPNRREFGRNVAALATASLFPGTAESQPDITAVAVDALADIARARFSKHMTDEQFREVKRGIAHDQRGAEILRRIKLKNGDEPAVIFHADV